MAETKVAKRSKYKYHVPVVSVRLVRETNFYSDKSISNPDDAGWLAYHFAKDFDREVFGVICLTTNGDIANISVVSMGSLDKTVVSVREVFKTAILANANSIILFHNHPSGNFLPSREDRAVTQMVCKAGKLLGIPVLDHIIVGKSDCYSFKDNNEDVLTVK